MAALVPSGSSRASPLVPVGSNYSLPCLSWKTLRKDDLTGAVELKPDPCETAFKSFVAGRFAWGTTTGLGRGAASLHGYETDRRLG